MKPKVKPISVVPVPKKESGENYIEIFKAYLTEKAKKSPLNKLKV